MEGLAARRPLELYDIAFGVGDVDRRALSFGSVPNGCLPRLDVVCFQLATDGVFIEWLDAKAEVIEVPPLLRWWRTAGPAELTIHGHEVDQRTPRTKLNQPYGVLASFDRAREYFAVEAKHAIEVDDPQHKVINLADTNHGRTTGAPRLSI